ncbi:MAG TPA: YchJ family metal-binding protein [Pusillimonas sp.]|uniref:YchJ family protein n=1 Tax=Pusillimonas sp. TaxID=3040095 RepID=UPI002D160647|nr:YchJ family metal-binding protein [Pusillimonas sp.]HUH86664.1 YchJ family metal-binding protein [Pusillimonas sp.]
MKKKRPSCVQTQCPCGSTVNYDACCGRWHHGPLRLMAPDAAALMRSRYTAFVLDELDYLLDTWHPSTRPAALDKNEPGTQWLGLEVRGHWQNDQNHATVEFVARSRHNGRALRLHETSRFVREDGIWLYLDGEF